MKSMCPKEEILVDYIEGRLQSKEKRLIDDHLSKCDCCLETIVIANSMNTEYENFEFQEVPNYVTQTLIQQIINKKEKFWNILITRTRRLIEQIKIHLSDFGMIFWTEWQLAPIRGARLVLARNQSRRRKAFDHLKTDIEIQKTGDNEAQIKIQVKRSGPEVQKIRVILLKRKLDFGAPIIDREIASDIIEENSVLFENIPFDHYKLTFTRDGVTLGRYLFQIK
ncbi:hypothetical protein MHK_005479 [Candidatus Magnetomorum sp. HK-1]|nr:hypothetical protein MHK_005479 [Candidatus Magnetomorum sp. HK-1]